MNIDFCKKRFEKLIFMNCSGSVQTKNQCSYVQKVGKLIVFHNIMNLYRYIIYEK